MNSSVRAELGRSALTASWDPQLSKIRSNAQALGFDSTPSFVVEGPGGKKVLGSGGIPLSQIESAIKSVQ